MTPVEFPYDYTDPDGDTLTVGRNGDGRVFLQTSPHGVTVGAGDLAEVFRAMCEAAGVPPAAVGGVLALPGWVTENGRG